MTTKVDNFKKNKYDLFIGVENGAIFLDSIKNIKNKHFISDFDTTGLDFMEKIKKEESRVTQLNVLREFTDGEEAIIYAINLGCKVEKIDFYVNENYGRKDHLLNVLNLSRKYGIKIIGNKFITYPIIANQWTIINKTHKYFSIFVYEETILNSKGLKWELNESKYNIDSGTGLISNEILENSIKIKSNKKIMVMQSND